MECPRHLRLLPVEGHVFIPYTKGHFLSPSLLSVLLFPRKEESSELNLKLPALQKHHKAFRSLVNWSIQSLPPKVTALQNVSDAG